MELSKLSKSYTRVLNEAGKLLKERNAVLKQDHIDFTYFEFELKIDRVEYKHIKMSLESESGPFRTESGK